MLDKIMNRINFYILIRTLVFFVLFQISSSNPIVSSTITNDNFIKELKFNNCSFPTGVAIPTKFSSEQYFEYLRSLLKICEDPQESKRHKEAHNLCLEIFDTLKNITCHGDQYSQLPEITEDFSKDVCVDITSLEFSSSSKSLLKHLNDKLVCDMMCDEEFLEACKVLLWSYNVQQKIDYALTEKVKEKEMAAENFSHEQLNEESNDKEHDLQNEKEPGESINKDKKLDEKAQISENKEIPPVTDPKANSASETNVPASKKATLANVNSEIEVTKDNSKTSSAKTEDVTPKAESEIKQKTLIEKSGNKLDASETGSEEVKSNTIDKSPLLRVKITSTNAVTSEKQTEANVDEENDKQLQELNGKNTNLNIENSLDEGEQPVSPDAKKTEEKAPEAEATSKITTPKVSISTKSDLNKTATSFKVEIKTPTKPSLAFQNKTTPVVTTAAKTGPPLPSMEMETENQANNEVSKLKTSQPELTNDNDSSMNTIPQNVNNEEETPPVTSPADLENMEDGNEIPQPADKDSFDSENENDYPKDYEYLFVDEDGFDDSVKIKKPETLPTKVQEPGMDSKFDMENKLFQSRNPIRGDEIQMIQAFPEQEDSHFFFYFLTIVLVLMAGYLIFHNKQKIIALIVEGRHERRRRSHGPGYRKLETK